MELHSFVKETLVQIIRGIVESQKDEIVKQNKASIVPHGVSSSDMKSANREIEFDIVVTTQSGSSTKGGLGIFVGGIGVGAQGKLDAKDLNENRVKFSVPVLFPMQKVLKEIK